jgi:hypothetical protein
MHPLIDALSSIAAAHPGARVRFIAREIPFARETLRELARARGALVGWDGTTLRQLAGEYAAPELASQGLRGADDIALQAASEDALAGTQSSRPAGDSLGFRAAAFDAFGELRLAGVTPEKFREAASTAGSPAHSLVSAYAAYVSLLEQRKLSDAADAFRAAIAVASSASAGEGVIVIEPGAADLFGLPRIFFDGLMTHGARVLSAADTTPDWSAIPATLTIERAASPTLEVRDALRHALAAGLRWDEVELAATDLDTYGSCLASLGDELDIPYTLKEGVPMLRSRAGRSLERYLRWIEDGLPSKSICEALEQGEIGGTAGDIAGTEVARVIQSLQIGWGHARWAAALQQLRDGRWTNAKKSRVNARATTAGNEKATDNSLLESLATTSSALIDRLLTIAPTLAQPAQSDAGSIRLRSSALAANAMGWLDLVTNSISEPSEQHALARLRSRLTELAAYERPELPVIGALAELRLGLADLRAFPSVDGERARRVSAPSAVHLTDISHAGVTGRRGLYLLGLDADRTSFQASTDPILDPDTRTRCGLPLLHERAARRERAVHRALNGLTGNVRLSYSTQSDSAGRESSPSFLLLGAARALFQQPSMTYEKLRDRLGAPAGAASGNAPLDRRDLWLYTLAEGGDLRDGRELVLSEWAPLARGFALHDQAAALSAGEWLGLIPDAATALGPFQSVEARVSPSSLEQLGKCALAWFYRYGLKLRQPDDAVFSATEWLDPLQHGSLVHKIFERFVSEWMTRQAELSQPEAQESLQAIMLEELERQRKEIPPPSEFAVARERSSLERLAKHFLAQERDIRDADWDAVETGFPERGGIATFGLADGTQLNIQGYIDRVDRYPDGSLRIIDYKSGSAYAQKKNPKAGPLNGGRILQPAIYARGAAQRFGAEVSAFEYRFPKQRAPNDRIAYGAEDFNAAPSVIASLLTHVRDGTFIPTNEQADCSYCEYRAICRVSGERDTLDSPRAEWGRVHGEGVPEYVEMMRRRNGEES